MIAILDVDYRDEGGAFAALVAIHDWGDATSTLEVVEHIAKVEPYVPGNFYQRELPCLNAVLAKVAIMPQVLVIDGYVWLGDGRPGLGAHLFDAVEHRIPVIGVAKTRFHSATAVEVYRGNSAKRPLWVTAAGIDATDVGPLIQRMHGEYRIPSMIRRVDQLCRSVTEV